MTSVLIFGGSGLCGGAVGKALQNDDLHLRIFARPGRSSDDFTFVPHSIFFGSVQNQRDLTTAMAGVTDIAFFLSTSVPATSGTDPGLEFYSTLPVLQNVLLAATQAGVKRIIFPSSGGAIYGAVEGAVAENFPRQPTSGYGLGKLMCEDLLQFYYRVHGLKYDILRIANVYGFDQKRLSPQGVIDVFLDNAIEGRTSEIWGSVDASRDYLFVDDLAESVRLLVLNPNRNSNIFNVGSGNSHSLGEIIEIIGKITDGRHKFKIVNHQYSGVTNIYLNCEKIYEELGWKARCDILTGIQRSWDMKRKSQSTLGLTTDTSGNLTTETLESE
jgi:UDP-glucose 4-epimerase